MLCVASTGCGYHWAADERAAIDACVDAGRESLPRFAATASDTPPRDRIGDLDQARFAFVGDGNFELIIPTGTEPAGQAFVCHGNLAGRYIERINSGPVVARGGNQAGWRY